MIIVWDFLSNGRSGRDARENERLVQAAHVSSFVDLIEATLHREIRYVYVLWRHKGYKILHEEDKE